MGNTTFEGLNENVPCFRRTYDLEASLLYAHLFVTQQGERRFYLGAVADDLFLATAVFDFNAPNQQGPAVRVCCFVLLVGTSPWFVAFLAVSSGSLSEVSFNHRTRVGHLSRTGG